VVYISSPNVDTTSTNTSPAPKTFSIILPFLIATPLGEGIYHLSGIPNRCLDGIQARMSISMIIFASLRLVNTARWLTTWVTPNWRI